MKTLILTAEEIRKIITVEEVIIAVEDVFRLQAKKLTLMPAKIYLPIEKYRGDFRAMPAYVEGSAGIKWVNSHPGNLKKGLFPSVMAVLIYSDPETGFPLAIMDATIITNYRTGAAGAIASKYLAHKNVKTLGLIGCGKQAETQLLFHNQIFQFIEIYVTDRNEERIKKFIKKFAKLPLRKSSSERVAGCDILCTTTPSRGPIVRAEWIKPGTHINAIGADAPGKQELDSNIVKKAKIVVDDYEQATRSGEINIPLSKGIISEKNIHSTLGEVIAGIKPGRMNDKEITVFDSTGLAIQDIAVAKVIYEKAKKLKIGTEVNLVGV
ncbi:MAG TPA: alanine dehydrogenase [Elusimicrobia bacterium]|jgi:alanine dehydrogenase|nr:alanine dehydrogenase [Elusimicrobiota bacterium]